MAKPRRAQARRMRIRRVVRGLLEGAPVARTGTKVGREWGSSGLAPVTGFPNARARSRGCGTPHPRTACSDESGARVAFVMPLCGIARRSDNRAVLILRRLIGSILIVLGGLVALSGLLTLGDPETDYGVSWAAGVSITGLAIGLVAWWLRRGT